MSVSTTDVVQWDVGNWSSAVDFWTRYGDVTRGGQEALEIGANQGGVSAWLASFGNRVICSDLEGTRDHARPMIERYGLLDRVTFEDIDATEIPYRERFDIVAFKSVLGGVGHDGAIDRQRRAMRAMYDALKPGGRLLFAENLTGSPLHGFLRRRFVNWGHRWRYVTVDEMRAFLSPYRSVRMETTGVLGTFGRSEPQRRALASVDRAGLNAIVPSQWRYIVYGVAVK